MKFTSNLLHVFSNQRWFGRIGACVGCIILGAAGLSAQVLDSTEVLVKPKVIQQVDEDLEVQFYYSKSKLKPGFLEQLKQLQIPPGSQVIIHGFASPDGSPKSELKLSQERARRIRQLLKKHVQNNATYQIIGHGRAKPRYSNGTPAERAKNRRATIKIEPAQVE